MPLLAVLESTTRECRARITVTCEQVTTAPDALCPACADQLDGFLATLDDDAPF